MDGFDKKYKDDILSDNTQFEYCQQCKDCVLWGHTDAFGNKPSKSSCDKFPYPDHKPMYVIHNDGDCPYREVGEN